MKELYGEKIIYDKKTHEPIQGDAFARPEGRKEDEGMFEEENVGSGDKFGAVLPFIGALVEPENHPPINPAEPTEEYALEYVYGYRSHDCRQNLYFTAGQKVVYNVAALGVVLDPNNNTQMFFGGGTLSKSSVKAQAKASDHRAAPEQHDDDIICLAISPDRKFVATGQTGPQPKLYIWNTETGKLKSAKSKFKITAKNCRAIGSCCWSGDGKYVAFVDKSQDHNIYVVDSETGSLVNSGKDGQQEVFDMAWSKKPGDLCFATVGARHINFWDFGNLSKPKTPGTGHGGKTFTCVTFDEQGTCYAGCTDGTIYSFTGKSKSGEKRIHGGMVQSINFADGKLLSGGFDGFLCIMDGSLNIESKIPMGSAPRGLDKSGDTILAGLKNGTVCLVSGGKIAKELLKAHHDGEVWGLEVLESGDVLTTGDDNKLMLWNAKERRNKAVVKISDKTVKLKYGASSMTAYPDSQCSRAVCYNPKTNELANATNTGEVQIRELTKLDVVKNEVKAADRWIEFMGYSPNGDYLAVGTHKNTIVVYNTDTYAVHATLNAHKSSITSLDWTKDSNYIRSNCEAYELLFFDMRTKAQVPGGATATKGLEWASNYTKIGWSVLGVFPKGTDGTHVNGVCLSADGKLLATGDDWGLVNLYRYPCREGNACKSFRYV